MAKLSSTTVYGDHTVTGVLDVPKLQANSVSITDTTASTTKTSGALIVAGGVGVGGQVTAESFNAGSLRSLKNDIEPFSKNALDIINTVDVASFTYKDDEEKNYHVGFIADDTHEILAGKNHDHMDIGNSIGVLIKAVQELSEKIRNLEYENILLKEKING